MARAEVGQRIWFHYQGKRITAKVDSVSAKGVDCTQTKPKKDAGNTFHVTHNDYTVATGAAAGTVATGKSRKPRKPRKPRKGRKGKGRKPAAAAAVIPVEPRKPRKSRKPKAGKTQVRIEAALGMSEEELAAFRQKVEEIAAEGTQPGYIPGGGTLIGGEIVAQPVPVPAPQQKPRRKRKRRRRRRGGQDAPVEARATAAGDASFLAELDKWRKPTRQEPLEDLGELLEDW
jgi:hypothetical protein